MCILLQIQLISSDTHHLNVQRTRVVGGGSLPPLLIGIRPQSIRVLPIVLLSSGTVGMLALCPAYDLSRR